MAAPSTQTSEASSAILPRVERAGTQASTPATPIPHPARDWLDNPQRFNAPDPVGPDAASQGAIWIGTTAFLLDGRTERFEIPSPDGIDVSTHHYGHFSISPDRERFFGWHFGAEVGYLSSYDRGTASGALWSLADTDLVINTGAPWSPDGTRAAFASLYPEPYLVVIDAAAGTASVVPLLETLRVPAIPVGWIDNDTLLMAELQATSLENIPDIIDRFDHLSLSTESVTERWERPGVSRPSLSPDGRFVAFWELRGTEIEDHLVIREIVTGDEVVLDDVPPVTSQRVWAPDSSALAFLKRPRLPGDHTARLEIFSVMGERLAGIDEFIERDQQFDGFIWSEDGRLIAAIGDRAERLDSRLVEWAEVDGEWRKVRHDSGWTADLGWIDAVVPLDEVEPLAPRIIATATPYPYP